MKIVQSIWALVKSSWEFVKRHSLFLLLALVAFLLIYNWGGKIYNLSKSAIVSTMSAVKSTVSFIGGEEPSASTCDQQIAGLQKNLDDKDGQLKELSERVSILEGEIETVRKTLLGKTLDDAKLETGDTLGLVTTVKQLKTDLNQIAEQQKTPGAKPASKPRTSPRRQVAPTSGEAPLEWGEETAPYGQSEEGPTAPGHDKESGPGEEGPTAP